MTASSGSVADTSISAVADNAVHDVEKAVSNSEPPDGGPDAWLAVFGPFLGYFRTLG